MTAGIVLLLLTGLCWVGIAAVVSHAARKRLDINAIQLSASLVIAAAAGVAMLCRTPSRVPGEMAAAVLVAGAGNFLMLNWMRRAMVTGNSGAVWGIVQSASVCPFAMGMLVFDVRPTWPRLLGMALVLLGIALFARTRPGRHGRGPLLWLWPTLGAFAASGLAQCFANLPSYWSGARMTPELRACLVQLGTVGMFALTAPLQPRKPRFRGTGKAVALLSAVQVLSLFFFFYRGLDLVAAHGGGSIGYPVAQGACIAFFLLYNRFMLKEKSGPLTLGALAAALAGIFALTR